MFYASTYDLPEGKSLVSYLVSMLFADLLSLHLHTFSMFFFILV